MVFCLEDMDKRRTVVSTVMNLRSPQNNRNFFSKREYIYIVSRFILLSLVNWLVS